jgi:FkbM family methyltransferase
VTSERAAVILRDATQRWAIRGIPRLLHGTSGWLLGDVPRVFDIGNGLKLKLDPRDYFQCMMFYGRWGLELLELFERYVRPGDTVLDVGAQIGFYSVHLGRMVTESGYVYSFEPDPRPLEYLRTSLSVSRMDWVRAEPFALSAREGQIDFNVSPVFGWSTAVCNTHLTGLQRVSVPTVPLDTLVANGTILGKIRLAKIDVEGFELEVLCGMRRVLRKARPILIMEVNRPMLKFQGTTPLELFEFLTSFRYTIYKIQVNKRWGRTRPLVTLPLWNPEDFSKQPAQQGHPFDPAFDVLCIPEPSASQLNSGDDR